MAARRSGHVQCSFEYPLYQLGKVIFAPPVTPLQGDAAHCSLGCKVTVSSGLAWFHASKTNWMMDRWETHL